MYALHDPQQEMSANVLKKTRQFHLVFDIGRLCALAKSLNGIDSVDSKELEQDPEEAVQEFKSSLL